MSLYQQVPATVWAGSYQETCLGHSESDECAEQVLVAVAKAGDSQALERLLAAHEHAILALCYGALGCREDAEDAVQETFYWAIRGLGGFRGGSAVRTWLARIAVNVCLRRRGKKRRAIRYSEALREHTASSPSVEDTVMCRLEITAALDHLPVRQRVAILLHGLQGYSPAEIARIMGCTRRRVYHDLSQAHDVLTRWRHRTE
jgi:RNA polymerase sigma-70 factor (ECF subfamily)